jgi:hypothetical protein
MEILSQIEYKETWLYVYVCMYIDCTIYELHNIMKERFYGHCTKKEHCRHNQHDDDDNGIKIKFPFSFLIVQQSL